MVVGLRVVGGTSFWGRTKIAGLQVRMSYCGGECPCLFNQLGRSQLKDFMERVCRPLI